VGLQAEVVVEVRGVVLLDDEDRAGVALAGARGGLGGPREVAFLQVLFQRHEGTSRPFAPAMAHPSYRLFSRLVRRQTACRERGPRSAAAPAAGSRRS